MVLLDHQPYDLRGPRAPCLRRAASRRSGSASRVAYQRAGLPTLRERASGRRAGCRRQRRLAARALPRVRRAVRREPVVGLGVRGQAEVRRRTWRCFATVVTPTGATSTARWRSRRRSRDDDDPPWGGLPRPTFLVAHLTDDAQRKIFDIWARESGAAFFALSSTVANEIPPSWHETIQHDWEADHRQRPSRPHGRGAPRVSSRSIETTTGRRFDEASLRRRHAARERAGGVEPAYARPDRPHLARAGCGGRGHPRRDAARSGTEGRSTRSTRLVRSTTRSPHAPRRATARTSGSG